MLLSGPAGGVTGAVWMAEQCGYARPASRSTWAAPPPTSRWCRASARGSGGRRKVGDLTVRASSVDVRTVGAGGGSIAHVPELTKALRVGPQSAGADPGPGRVRQGRHRADRHRRQRRARLPAAVAGGRRDHARRRRGAGRGRRPSPTRWGWSRSEAAAAGHRRHRQREHARRPAAGVGAAGLRPAGVRARRVRRRGPAARQRAGQADRGVAGDRAAVARRAVRAGRRDDVGRADESARTVLRRFADLDRRRPARDPRRARRRGRAARWPSRACRAEQQTTAFQVDVRYHGQGFEIPIEVDRPPDLDGARRPRSTPSTSGCSRSCSPSTTSWSTPAPRSPGRGRRSRRSRCESGDGTRRRRADTHPIYVEGGWVDAAIYDRGDAAGRRRDQRARDRHRDGLDHPGPARPRGHRARVRAAC